MTQKSHALFSKREQFLLWRFPFHLNQQQLQITQLSSAMGGEKKWELHINRCQLILESRQLNMRRSLTGHMTGTYECQKTKNPTKALSRVLDGSAGYCIITIYSQTGDAVNLQP